MIFGAHSGSPTYRAATFDVTGCKTTSTSSVIFRFTHRKESTLVIAACVNFLVLHNREFNVNSCLQAMKLQRLLVVESSLAHQSKAQDPVS